MDPRDVSPLQVLLLIWAADGQVSVDGDRLTVRGARMCDELRTAIRHNKPELLRILQPASSGKAAA